MFFTIPDGFGLRLGRLVSARAVPDKEGALEMTDLAVGVFSKSPKAGTILGSPAVGAAPLGGRQRPAVEVSPFAAVASSLGGRSGALQSLLEKPGCGPLVSIESRMGSLANYLGKYSTAWALILYDDVSQDPSK